MKLSHLENPKEWIVRPFFSKEPLKKCPQISFEERVRYVQSAMRRGSLKKIVLSAEKTIERACSAEALYEAMAIDPHLYRYRIGQEIVGASPERLFHYKDGIATTDVVAGTAPFSPKKEREFEWSLRTIHDAFLEEASDVRVSERTIFPSSTLLHYKATIQGRVQSPFSLLERLHPTASVGGYPKNEANAILEELEPDRGLYAGTLVGISETEILAVVMIRMIRIEGSTLRLRAGAGITIESDPEEEWEEILNKFKAIERYVDHALSR